MNRTLSGVLALSAAFACGGAQANRPLNTDTADTIAPHRCQFEPYAVANRLSGAPDEHASTLQLNCGVSSRTQLGVAAARESDGDESSRVVFVGGKTQLIDMQDGRIGVSLGYGLTAARTAAESWSQDVAAAYLIATGTIVHGLLGHVNLGTAHSRIGRQNSTTWGTALEWSVKPRFVISAETYGDDHAKPWVSGGLWWGLLDNVSVNVSTGRQLSTPRVRQVTAGFNIEF